jgi:hypothetical protein
MDLDTLIREADPARRLTIPKADQADARQISARTRHSLGRTLSVLWVGTAVTVALAIAVVALVIGGRRHSSPPAAPVPAAARPLTSILGVLRRPQTAADRAVEPTIRKLRTPEPALVRLATVTPWGEQVILAPLKGRRYDTLGMFEVDARGTPGGGVSCGCGLTPALIEAGRGLALEGAGRNFAGGSTAVRLFIVVPDGVAKVVFVLPRQPTISSNPGGPVYRDVLRVPVMVKHNVAAVQVDRECCDGRPPMVWYSADGHLIRTFGNVAAAGRLVRTIKPAPETARSRAAERDPSTSNRVQAVPRTGGPHTNFQIRWRLLLTDADYAFQISGPTGRHCYNAGALGGMGGGAHDLRGQIYGESLAGASGGQAWCIGTYHVSVAVKDLGRAGNLPAPPAPFGTATFIVRR